MTYPIEPLLDSLGIKYNPSKMGNQPIVCEEWRPVPNHPDYEEDSVRCIRALVEGGRFSQTQIARAFNTQQSTVSQIAHRKAWAHVV